MAKPNERRMARDLRKKGQSIKHIAKKLGVSQSSASLWCRDIQLSQEQIEKLEKQGRDPFYGRRLTYALSQQKAIAEKTKMLFDEGVSDVGVLSERELFLVGIALYWAEGFKKDSQAGFANSNPRMIKLFLEWLFICCGYTKEDLILRVTVNESHKDRIDIIQKYWSDILEIEAPYFQKPYFQKVKWKKTYDNPDEYFGVLRLKVRKSKDFLRKIHGWIEGLALSGF